MVWSWRNYTHRHKKAREERLFRLKFRVRIVQLYNRELEIRLLFSFLLTNHFRWLFEPRRATADATTHT